MYHYVYRITCISESKHYYGKRSSKIEPSKDLGTKYFSSSKDKDFVNSQKSNPRNFAYKIIRLFTTSEEAILFEIKLHVKLNVAKSPHFYNRAQQTSTGFVSHKRSIETRKKLSNAAKRTNNGAKTTYKRAQSNRRNGDAKWKSYIALVTNSSIDFSLYGWVGKVSKILNIAPQKVSKWMRRHCPDIFETCFKRANPTKL